MRSIIAIAVLSITGCDSNMVWDKPDGSQAEFNRDDYACRRDAISAGGYVYIPVGTGLIDRLPDGDMYKRCMRAQGYSLR